ncbi:hypothetical protein [Nocardioides zhouii]|uniref:Uncharacterized protein n=1 Tax=Nocardioides zhouii TaxID=1168729 RepID=A0A4V1RPU4_9ACTN|nr:hypothetical protein [Nocardioides zhouii]RYC10567.1 hypothetical protein EUA94_12280 [Nocardioides zhouii]
MTLTTTPQQARATHDEWLDRRWRLTGALFGLLALVAAALLVTTGMRPATYGDLLADVASSKVSEVQVVGDEPPAKGDRVELRWSVWNGLLDQYAVVQVDDSRGYNAWDESVFVSAVDPRDTLRGINSGITLTSGSSLDAPSTSVHGWRAPGAVVLLVLATWLGILLLLVGGPEPWRATRWAWAWFVLLAGPLGCVAYLLLGGPLGVARPRAGHRRLTGGWAFVVAMFFFSGSNAA